MTGRSKFVPIALLTLALVAATQVPGRTAGGQDRERPRGPVDPTSCGQCHSDVATHDFVHGPVGVGACAACHETENAEAHTYRLAREGAALCTYCHDLSLDAPVVHEPLRTGDCIGCHDPHGGRTRSMLPTPSVDDLCSRCHADFKEGMEHVHGPVAAGACSACHAPHASSHASLLDRPVVDLCKSCHVDTAAELDHARYVHGPAAVDCTVCHESHASHHPRMLRDEGQAMCTSCHESIRHTVETATTQHAAVTTDRQCLNCHAPHASDHPRVLRSDMRSLCYECHDKPIELPDGKTLANIKAVIEGGTSLHGPVAQDNCAACHMVHGGDHFRLLVQEYPAEFYAPFAEERYALCFGCHDRQLVLDERTTSLTNFRNGDLNLHFLHVNRDKKGRTCRACHETHASVKEKHIRETVPFGGWDLPIAFDKTDTGGSCAPGCHKPYAYDRETPVALPSDRGEATWPGEGR